MSMGQVAVVGSGNWGTAYARILADAGNQVRLWARRPELAEAINTTRRNVDYQPDLDLPEGIEATSDFDHAVDGAQIVVLAVPSQTLRGNLESWRERLPAEGVVVSLMKGVEIGTNKRMSEVIVDAGGVDPGRIVVVSGPNLAPEIARGQPAAAVVASSNPRMRAQVAEASAAPYFRPYLGADVIGTEIAGATKNVVALAVGIAAGLGLGDNTAATLLTRGLAETARLGVALGADPQTFLGLAGVGDLVATCTSPLSRNRSFGYRIGQGMTIEEASGATNQVTEGVKSCSSIRALALQAQVEMPIVDSIYALINEGRRPEEMADLLMSRARKHEGN